MSQPAPYAPATYFRSYQGAQPWFPGQNIDVELEAIETTTNQIRANLALIQRDDGALANGVVTFNSLSPTLQTQGLAPLTAWATGVAFTVPQAVIDGTGLYQCAIAHTSGVFADDLAAGKWTLLANLSMFADVSTAAANLVAAGPTSGPAAPVTFRALVGADLPTPAATTLGGVKSLAAVTHQFLTSIGTDGTPTQAQPEFSDLSGSIAAAQLIAPTATTLGGVKSLTAVTHQFLTSIGTDGVPTQAQPAVGDISGFGTGVATALAVNVGTAGSPLVNGGALGTPASGIATNLTGTAAGLTAGNVTTNANTTGDVSSSGNVTTLAANQKIAAIEYVIDGGGSTITTGMKGYLEVPFACTITQATLLGDQSGSIVVDVFKCTYANFAAGTHPVSGDKITASAPPTISSSTKSQDTTLTGWTTAISAGDILGFNVNSVTTTQRVTISLKATKT